MKTLKYILQAIPFPRSFNKKNLENTGNDTLLELSNNGFGLKFKTTKGPGKVTNSLLTQMYSEENNTLFI